MSFNATTRVLGVGVLCLAAAPVRAQWTRLAHDPPQPINLMLLLSDGTVMAAHNEDLTTTTAGREWYRLTPDASGSYVNGTWTTLASMIDTRLYYQSQVLRDGRVYISGGEYGTGGSRAEIYNPQTNIWTAIAPPASLWTPGTDVFYDCNSEILPDGSVLVMPVFPHTSGVGLRYNPATNTWSNAGRLFRGNYQDEATWTKLPDNSILTIDPFGTSSERYIPATNSWVNDSVVPTSLYDPFGLEIGGSLLLPNGKAFFIGSTGHTALYTPSGTAAPGSWIAGPNIPGSHGTPDAPAAMMPNGKVLMAVSPVPTSANHFPTPTTFYEYDWAGNSFASVAAPTGASDNIPCYASAMLVLPDGNVLYSHMQTSMYVYHPSGAALAQGKPTIQGVTANGGGSYHLSGLGLNGISEGATYGDDFQMNTNYPIVRLSRGDGNAYYARSYNWSSTGVMTGAAVVTTEFAPPAALPPGVYSVVVVANGIASDPFCLSAPTITQAPQSRAACRGPALSLSITAAGYGSLTYQWRHNGAPIGNNASAATSTLTIASVAGADAGMYTCTVANACDQTTSGPIIITVCIADTDDGTGTGACDGGVTIDDLLYYLGLFAAGAIAADVDDGSGTGMTDQGVTIDDLLFFLAHFSSGCQ